MTPKLIGFYQTDDQAEHARDDLRNAGFDWKEIHVYRGGREGDLWEGAGGVDRKLYQEASKRGATAVMLDLDETMNAAQQALNILRRHHPMEMAKATWRGQGWQGSMQPQRQPGQGEQQMQPRPQPQVQPQAQAQPQPPVQAQARPQPHPQPQPRQAPVQSEDEKIIPVVEDEMLPSGMEAQGAEPEPVEAQPEQTESQQTQSGQVQQPQAHHEAEPEVVFSAKRFATELAGDERFRGREWCDIEPYVKREFERRFPNDSWDEHSDAIVLGFVRACDGR